MKNRKPLWITILVLSVAVFIGGAVYLIFYLLPAPELPYDEVTTAQTQEQTAPTAAPTDAPTEAPTVNSFGYELDEYTDWRDISFEELYAINTDIYAWIYIPDTNVDYPVVQSISDGDDSFYLSHNIYRDYQFSGAIYSQVQNSTRFTDRVTVLYGHNMLNGSMFASLHQFEDQRFFNEHTTMFVVTEDRLLTYLIYSAYVYDDRHILNSFNLDDDEVFLSYLDSTLDPRTYSGIARDGIELDTDSRILTLSTCTNGASNTRYLVQGVLVNEEPR